MKLPGNFQPPSLSHFKGHLFHPVMELPSDFEVFDFTKGYDPNRERGEYGIGKYDEHRPGMYTQDLFTPGSEQPRTVHMGVDLGAPAGTPVYSFMDGELLEQKIHPAAGDYGPTIITAHSLSPGVKIHALWGHLSEESLKLHAPGESFPKGKILGYVGEREENGGWNPHLHFQLSWICPEGADLPGVVTLKDRTLARTIFPDPRLVLGPLY